MLIKAFNWYGGKFRVVLEILSCIPWHITDWYEACMGSAAVTLNSARHRVEVISDMDEDLVHLFSMLADRVDGANLVDRLMGLQYSESEFVRAMRAKSNRYKTVDDFRRAEMIYVAITQSFNSTRKGFRRRGVSQRDYTFMSQSNLPEVHRRLQGVRVYQMDCVEAVRKVHNNPNAFVFLDVPYRWELRAKGACNIYGYEMDMDHHIKLLKVCRDAKCCIMLCGYRQTDGKDLYDKYLGVGLSESPWQQYTLAELVKACQTTDSKDVATETIWVNYPLPDSARDYINTGNLKLVTGGNDNEERLLQVC